MRELLIVGVGGACGAMARHVAFGMIHRRFPAFLPAGTMAVNVLGCLLIGFLMGFAVDRRGMNPELRLFLATGLLGAFTTFSTFGYETVELLREREVRLALFNIAGNLLLGLPAVWCGRLLSRAFTG